MMAKIYLVLMSLCTYSLFGQNIVPAIISENTTLTKSNSPYTLNNTTINSGATLTIEAGVVVEFADRATLTVKGKLIANGNENDSVYFSSSGGTNATKISPESANVELHYVKANTDKSFIFGTGGNVLISHCNITSTADGNGEDCIAMHDAKKIVIEYITLKGAGGDIEDGIKNDAIDLDNCDSCFLSYNNISNFADDAIDIGTQTKYAYIHDNILNHCNYGVTVGESSLAYLINNTSSFNDGGFEIHTGATVYCENNVLYSNTYGIDVYHREYAPDQNGGNAIIKNTIFSKNTAGDIATQTSSTVSVSYSLSDKDTLEGNNNLCGDPLFTNPGIGDFSLKTGSPGLNNGIDEKGNPVNIGLAKRSKPSSTNITFLAADELTFYPNPCSGKANIKLQLGEEESINLSVISLEGKVIESIFKGTLGQGEHEFGFNPGNSHKGIYIISIRTDNYIISKKILIK